MGAAAAPGAAGAVAPGAVGALAAADAEAVADHSPSRWLIRSIAAVVAGAVAAAAAVLLGRNGIRTDTFPPFLDGTSSTTITRYSGPWLTAAAGAALLAALLLLSAVRDLRRWVVVRRSGGPDGHARGAHPDVIGATSP